MQVENLHIVLNRDLILLLRFDKKLTVSQICASKFLRPTRCPNNILVFTCLLPRERLAAPRLLLLGGTPVGV